MVGIVQEEDALGVPPAGLLRYLHPDFVPVRVGVRGHAAGVAAAGRLGEDAPADQEIEIVAQFAAEDLVQPAEAALRLIAGDEPFPHGGAESIVERVPQGVDLNVFEARFLESAQNGNEVALDGLVLPVQRSGEPGGLYYSSVLVAQHAVGRLGAGGVFPDVGVHPDGRGKSARADSLGDALGAFREGFRGSHPGFRQGVLRRYAVGILLVAVVDLHVLQAVGQESVFQKIADVRDVLFRHFPAIGFPGAPAGHGLRVRAAFPGLVVFVAEMLAVELRAAVDDESPGADHDFDGDFRVAVFVLFHLVGEPAPLVAEPVDKVIVIDVIETAAAVDERMPDLAEDGFLPVGSLRAHADRFGAEREVDPDGDRLVFLDRQIDLLEKRRSADVAVGIEAEAIFDAFRHFDFHDAAAVVFVVQFSRFIVVMTLGMDSRGFGTVDAFHFDPFFYSYSRNILP